MRAGRELRQIVIARIADQVPALTAVVDDATEDTAYPFASMGPSNWIDASSECIEARDISLQVDLWHSMSVSKGALEDIADDVAAALDGFADTDRLTMHPIRVTLVNGPMSDPDRMSRHSVVMIEAMVEQD